jgi:hypothetical protein
MGVYGWHFKEPWAKCVVHCFGFASLRSGKVKVITCNNSLQLNTVLMLPSTLILSGLCACSVAERMQNKPKLYDTLMYQEITTFSLYQ